MFDDRIFVQLAVMCITLPLIMVQCITDAYDRTDIITGIVNRVVELEFPESRFWPWLVLGVLQKMRTLHPWL